MKICKLYSKFHILSKLLILILLGLYSQNLYSQPIGKIDSLKNLIPTTEDSFKVSVLKQLCWEYRNLDTSLALSYGNNALTLAEKLNLPFEKTDILGRLGIVKRNQGKYSSALDYYFISLEMSQRFGFKELEAYAFNNIADIYNRLGIYDKALNYVKQGLAVSLKTRDKYNLAYIYNVMGSIYISLHQLDSAMNCFHYSLNLRKDINYFSGIGTSYLNIGLVFESKGNLDSSFIYYNKALDVYSKMDDNTGIANTYKCLGSYYNNIGEYGKAIFYFDKSFNDIKRFGNLHVQKEAVEGLKNAYSKLGDIKNAYYYQEIALKINDSIANYINVEKITKLTENFNFEIKRKEQELVRKQQEKFLMEKINFQKKQLILFILATILLFILFGIIIFLYRDKIKAYKDLNKKSEVIQELNTVLLEVNSKIKTQKEEIELQRDNLKQQHEKLDKLNSTKDKLFSVIGHDLRGPISSINSVAEILKFNSDQLSKEEFERLIGNVYEVSNNTYKLLENLLSWAKAQTHQVNIKLETVRLDSLVKETVDNYIPLANSKNIALIYVNSLPYVASTDKNIFQTILRNLISNAIKYTLSNGYIRVELNQNEKFVEISITDNGVGIPDDQIKKIFNSLEILSQKGTANETGTGFGLIICKEFVAILGGKIWLNSKLGHGSTFTFSIPSDSSV